VSRSGLPERPSSRFSFYRRNLRLYIPRLIRLILSRVNFNIRLTLRSEYINSLSFYPTRYYRLNYDFTRSIRFLNY